MPRIEQLVVEYPPAAYVLEGDTWVNVGGADFSNLGQYQQIDLGSNYTGFFLESSIDLAGFFLDEDTVLVPQAYLIQDPGFYKAVTASGNYSGSQGVMYAMEICSTRKLDMQTIFADLFVSQTYAGSPLSIYDKQQIVIGELRSLMPNLPVYDPNTLAAVNSPGVSVLNRQSSFGYTEKIANKAVYCYRCILPYLSNDADTFVIPPLRMRLEVAVDKVSAPEFIFALKRNVELNQV
jgi:hypothetical protein